MTWWLIEAWRDKIQVYAAEWLFVRPLLQEYEEEGEDDKENNDDNKRKKEKKRREGNDEHGDREAKVSEIFHVSMAAWCG